VVYARERFAEHRSERHAHFGAASVSRPSSDPFRIGGDSSLHTSNDDNWTGTAVAPPAADIIFLRVKDWLVSTRDLPLSALGLRNSLKQLCRHKRMLDARKVLKWFEQQRLVEIQSEADDALVVYKISH